MPTPPLRSPYLPLAIAILSETVATSTLKLSNGFTRLWPSVITVAGYGIAFFCLSVCLRSIPVGLVYAIWSGVGIVLISAIGLVVFHQKLDRPAILGVALILAGVLVINLFSKSSPH